jgi:hypothetical protein
MLPGALRPGVNPAVFHMAEEKPRQSGGAVALLYG